MAKSDTTKEELTKESIELINEIRGRGISLTKLSEMIEEPRHKLSNILAGGSSSYSVLLAKLKKVKKDQETEISQAETRLSGLDKDLLIENLSAALVDSNKALRDMAEAYKRLIQNQKENEKAA